jgi:hypothetical protein
MRLPLLTSLEEGMIRVVSVEFTEAHFTVFAEVELSYDPAYGADADGQRGIGMWFVEDSRIISVEDSQGNRVPWPSWNLPTENELLNQAERALEHINEY